MAVSRVLVLGIGVAILVGTSMAFAFTIDNQTGNNPDGSARYRDPEQTLPHFSSGFASWPGAYVKGDSYSSGDMLVPPYHPPAAQAPQQNSASDKGTDSPGQSNR